jgi:hypothetical protein
MEPEMQLAKVQNNGFSKKGGIWVVNAFSYYP